MGRRDFVSLFAVTVRFTLRRRWKLALAVFILGAGVAALSLTTDVNVFATEIERMAEAEQEPSTEEIEAIAGNAFLFFINELLRFLFLSGVIIFGLAVPGGLVARERRSGAIMLWAQHPSSLVRFYGRRFLAMQSANFPVQLAFALLAGISALGLGEGAGGATSAGAEVMILGLLTCSLSFGISAAGIRRSSFAGIGYILLSQILLLLFADGSPLARGFGEYAANVAPFALFPAIGTVTSATEGFQAAAGWDWGAAGIVLYHFALWPVLAALALRRVERRPIPL